MRYAQRIILLFLLLPLTVFAAVIEPQAPPALAQWRGWIEQQHLDLNCVAIDAAAAKNCQWHSALDVTVVGKQIKFSQQVTLQSTGWLILPGGPQAWPEQVSVDSDPRKILRHKGMPALYLDAGDYQIDGSILSATTPQSLQLAPRLSFINLRVNDREIAQPSVQNNRLLFNQTKTVLAKKTDTLEVQVFRLLKDGYPMWLTSRIELNVAGEPRMETLARVLPEGFELAHIQSKLPLRIDSQGKMQIQLRPGRHLVILKAHQRGEISEYRVAALKNWPQQELWSFQSNRSYRIADLQGSPIDASQTDIPKQWRQFSSYLVEPEHPLSLTERSRGNISPDAHQLSLERTLWLSFNGSNYTSQEHLNGSFGYLDRLSANSDYQAGSVKVNGKPTLLTSVNNDKGIELLPGAANIESVGKVVSDSFSVNPWNRAINSARLTINLPPGFSLFAATGADNVTNSYLARWDLWQIFILILFVVTLSRVYSWQTGAIGLAYGLAIHTVSSAPQLLLLLALVGFHLVVQRIAVGKLQRILNHCYQGALVLIVLSFLPFAVEQLRLAIHPQLERPYQMEPVQSINQRSQYREEVMSMAVDEVQQLRKQASSLSQSKSVAPAAPVKIKTPSYRDDAIVQTGPGLPDWQWNSVVLRWDSPVESAQQVSLYLVPPMLNRTLNVLRLVLFLLLAYFFVKHKRIAPPRTETNTGNRGVTPNASALALLVAVLMSSAVYSPQAQASEFPSKALLEQYYQRLSAPAPCSPDCSAINKVSIFSDPNTVKLSLQTITLSDSSLVLPVDARTMPSAKITLDGEPAKQLQRLGNKVYLLLSAGEHRIGINLNSRDINQLLFQFEQPPHLVSYQGDGWKVSGLQGKSIPSGRLHLRRIKRQDESAKQQRLTQGPLKPLVRINRRISLDLNWNLTTTVTRIAPSRGAISLRVPLLDGESVTSDVVKVNNGQALVNFAPGTRQITWQSRLQKQSPLLLMAAPSDEYYQQWQLTPTLRWHLSFNGLAPIKNNRLDAPLTWWPRSGDQLEINVSEPLPVVGKSLTLENVDYNYTPGKRQSSSELALTFRASKGGEFPIQLPQGATIESIMMNGRSIIYLQQESKVMLPVAPGDSQFTLHWKNTQPLSFTTRTAALTLGEASNINISTKLPRNRWVLAVSGPLIGPAVLFWGVLLLILALGYALGRQSWSPLKSWQWMLLGTGLATSFWPINFLVILWFVALSQRHKMINQESSPRLYNLVQCLLLVLTAVMLLALVSSVSQSLIFAAPDMQISGNGSYASSLHWYQDNSAAQLPTTTVWSIPMWSYQLLMLLWSIWLCISLLGWLKWGWNILSSQGLMRKVPKKIILPKQKNNTAKSDAWGEESDS